MEMDSQTSPHACFLTATIETAYTLLGDAFLGDAFLRNAFLGLQPPYGARLEGKQDGQVACGRCSLVDCHG